MRHARDFVVSVKLNIRFLKTRTIAGKYSYVSVLVVKAKRRTQLCNMNTVRKDAFVF